MLIKSVQCICEMIADKIVFVAVIVEVSEIIILSEKQTEK